MNIGLIGSGNVATVLGRKFREAGHKILQVAGRNEAATSALANQLESTYTTHWEKINTGADIILIAVSDNAIKELVQELKLPGCVVVHTAAAVSLKILESISPHYGVFYPLQSLRKDMVKIPEIPIMYDGSDGKVKNMLVQLAKSISSIPAIMADDDERLKLHVAAVIVNNFTNYLYSVAEEFCLSEGLNFRNLLPLIEETAIRIRDISPGKAQTGPAIRQDDETIQKHLELLEKHSQAQQLYTFLSEMIVTKNRS